ncbi:MAG: 3-deoxy-7-phosphoheptulonate synthase, partial [Gemmataceae bacterium]
MHLNASQTNIDAVAKAIESMGLQAHPLPGSTRTAIGITGNITAVDPDRLASMEGVLELVRVTRPYKLASREMHPDNTVVKAPQTIIGGGNFTLIAGPCSVESEALTLEIAEFLTSEGVHLLRAGAFKPRTSPYSFQGMGREGLEILKKVRAKTGIGIVTELM